MRIIGGALRGRKIEPPTSRTTRPMMDRIRQALFNILEHHDWGQETGNLFRKTNVLDAFCGTGALAFEALSRGAQHATLFDTDRQALKTATINAAHLNLTDRSTILNVDALKPSKAHHACRLIFLAPPYRKGLIPPALDVLQKQGWIAPHAIILAETAKKEELPLPEGFALLFSRFYADTGLHFLKN